MARVGVFESTRSSTVASPRQSPIRLDGLVNGDLPLDQRVSGSREATRAPLSDDIEPADGKEEEQGRAQQENRQDAAKKREEPECEKPPSALKEWFGHRWYEPIIAAMGRKINVILIAEPRKTKRLWLWLRALIANL